MTRQYNRVLFFYSPSLLLSSQLQKDYSYQFGVWGTREAKYRSYGNKYIYLFLVLGKKIILKTMAMRQFTLENELMGLDKPKMGVIRPLDYERIITKLQETVRLMQKQILYLRQYVNYVAGDCEENTQEEKKDITSKQTIDGKEQPELKMNKKINGLKGLINQVMKMIDAKTPDEILMKLKALEEKANRKLEPVFLERVKTKQVPVIIEKPVEKIVHIEKVVEVEKKVEVPVFREKVVEKYIEKPTTQSSLKSNEAQLPSQKPMKKIPPNPYEGPLYSNNFSSSFNYFPNHTHFNQSLDQLTHSKKKPYEGNNTSRGGNSKKNHNYQNKSQKYRQKSKGY